VDTAKSAASAAHSLLPESPSVAPAPVVEPAAPGPVRSPTGEAPALPELHELVHDAKKTDARLNEGARQDFRGGGDTHGDGEGPTEGEVLKGALEAGGGGESSSVLTTAMLGPAAAIAVIAIPLLPKTAGHHCSPEAAKHGCVDQ